APADPRPSGSGRGAAGLPAPARVELARRGAAPAGGVPRPRRPRDRAAAGARGRMTTCPACGAHGLTAFYEVERVPVHSCRLVATREEADAFPTGSLHLAVCSACGFVTNTAFDPSLQNYAISYEETQGFSPRFVEFARELAEHWVERYDLRGKDV